MGEALVPWPVVRALVGLTERALATGLEAAVAELAEHTGPTPSPGVARAVEEAIDSARRALVRRSAEAAKVAELRELATVDDLTGALNRRAFFERFDDELKRRARSDAPLTLVLCDLDGFKAINDAHGHPAGDAALRAFAALLQGNLRSSDAVGRIGGDEFGLLLVESEVGDVGPVLDRFSSILGSGLPELRGAQASFGAAGAPQDGEDRERLVAAADARLYEAKRAQT